MGFFLAYDSRMHCVSLIRNFKLKMYIFESRITVCCVIGKITITFFFFRSWAHAIKRPTRLVLRPLYLASAVPIFQFPQAVRDIYTLRSIGSEERF